MLTAEKKYTWGKKHEQSPGIWEIVTKYETYLWDP